MRRIIYASWMALVMATSGAATAEPCLIDLVDEPMQVRGEVFIDGNRFFAAVNAFDGLYDDGAVFLYRLINSELIEIEQLNPPIKGLANSFGGRIAADDDVLAIGDYFLKFEESGGSGAVFLYDRTTLKLQSAILTPSDDFENNFGRTMVLRDDVLVVGAVFDEVDGFFAAGTVFIYHRNNEEQWILKQTIECPSPDADFIHFGSDFALAGDFLAIGAAGEEGRVYVYRLIEKIWEQQYVLKGDVDFSWFGHHLALGEAYAPEGKSLIFAVTASQEASQDGRVYIYEIVDGKANFIEKLAAEKPVGPFASFGFSGLSMTADAAALLVGAPGDFELGFKAGAAHLFHRIDGQYVEMAKLLPIFNGNQQFGSSSTFDSTGDVALLTAPVSPGEVYLFAGLTGSDCDNSGVADGCEIFDGLLADINGNLTPDICECLGDVDVDGAITSSDLNLVLAAFAAVAPDPDDHSTNPDSPLFEPHPADIDQDGFVDSADLNILLSGFGGMCP